MKRNVAERIVQAAEESAFQLSLRPEYNARGMYGGVTAAIVYENLGDLLVSVALAAVAIEQEQEAGLTESDFPTESEDGPVTLEDLTLDLKDVRTDNMGRGYVVY